MTDASNETPRVNVSGKKTVSLVISVWNRKDDLRENLATIRQQTVPVSYTHLRAHET